MAQVKTSISSQIYSNDGLFNNESHQRPQKSHRRTISSIDRTMYSNAHTYANQQPTNDRRKISSRTSSINDKLIKEGERLLINSYFLSKTEERASMPFPKTNCTDDHINDLLNSPCKSLNIQRTKSNEISVTGECATCLLDQPVSLFEKYFSHQCQHLSRTICDTCIYNTIKFRIENMTNSNIFCPEPDCTALFSFESIHYILKMNNNIELFERYDRQLTHEYLEKSQDFVWCAHNGCDSGQFHDMGMNSNLIVICVKCQNRTCAFHRIKWHSGMTCQQYDQSILLSVDDNTEMWLRKNAKECPQCQTYIEKSSGCDHMTCRKCKHEFCWDCFADYRQIHKYGPSHHMKHCLHYPYYRHRYGQRSISCSIL